MFTIHPAFYGEPIHLTSHEIITLLGITPLAEHKSSQLFHGVASLDQATASQISYCHQGLLKNTHYANDLKNTKAGAVLVTEDMATLVPKDTLCWVTKTPYRDFAKLIKAFYPELSYTSSQETSIHPSAIIHETARIAKGCHIGPYVMIGADVSVGEETCIMAHTTVDKGCVIGRHCRIDAHVTLSHCIIGDAVHIKSGARIGQSGFGFEMDAHGPIDMPQMGSVMIDHHVEIGANTCIDRGSFGDTLIGSGTRIDNLVQIAHNVKIGKNCIIVAQVGISGSTTFGNYAMAGGQAGFAGHLKIGDGARIAAQSGVMRDIPPQMDMAGSPALPARDWHKQTIALKKIIRGKV